MRQLAAVLEDNHADPYSRGGGRVAFARRLQEALAAVPPGGLTPAELRRLVRAVVAGVGDGHTGTGEGDTPAENPAAAPGR